jgi:hypothetical protein
VQFTAYGQGQGGLPGRQLRFRLRDPPGGLRAPDWKALMRSIDSDRRGFPPPSGSAGKIESAVNCRLAAAKRGLPSACSAWRSWASNQSRAAASGRTRWASSSSPPMSSMALSKW